MNEPNRPVLRWHGGKWILAPWIISHFPAHRIYVEPFGGAGSVLLRKARCYAEIYNDLDDEVVNLFAVLRNSKLAFRLIEQLQNTPYARAEFSQAYEATDEPLERARRLVIRSFMGFGSNSHMQSTGFRANSNRSGTTPAHDWAGYPQALEKIVERLAGVVIENKDALELMSVHDGVDTLHYVDPPYVFATRSDMRKDYAHELTDSDHRQLLDVLKSLKGMVILSGYPNSIYDGHLDGWQRVEKAALADGAKKRTEVLWINPACRDALAVEQYPLIAGLN